MSEEGAGGAVCTNHIRRKRRHKEFLDRHGLVETKIRSLLKLDCSASHITEPFLPPTPVPTIAPTSAKQHTFMHLDPCRELLLSTCHSQDRSSACLRDSSKCSRAGSTSCKDCFTAHADQFQQLNCDMHSTSELCDHHTKTGT
jgi:hypothetical protein